MAIMQNAEPTQVKMEFIAVVLLKRYILELNLRELKDSELLDAYQRTTDTKYFQEIFRRYVQRIRSCCLKFFRGNVALAEDATQDTFTKALEKIHQSAIENIGAWLYTVAKHSCIDMYRTQWTPLESVSTSPETSLKINGVQEQEKQAYLQQLRYRLNQLRDEQRICLKLYLEGYSYKEISRMTQFHEKEVKSAIQTGKENLKKRFVQDEGG